MFAQVAERYGRLDILVNNAASGVQRSASDLQEKHLGLDAEHQRESALAVRDTGGAG